MAKIKVLVVDDSAVYRELLAREIEKDPDFEVMGRAADPIIAKKLIAGARPDVLTLDVEMPRQDGLSFLGELMASDPLPVVMVSSVTEAGCEATLRAFALGAVDVIAKPRDGDTVDLGKRVRDAVRAAAEARPRVPGASPPPQKGSGLHPPVAKPPGQKGSGVHAPVGSRTGILLPASVLDTRLVAIGASTGGTEALKEVLRVLPPAFPPVVIVQHMPDAFTGGFARSLASLGSLEVIEAPKEDTELRPGQAILARGGYHLLVAQEGVRLVTQVRDGPPVRNHRPSVDVLFTSVAKTYGDRALGVILTGMGDDGARGLLRMREAGARTFAQDAASCVVYGMPRRAVELGAVEKQVALEQLGPELVRALARAAS